MSERRPIWEPWRPAVGQRVRVRLSGECPGQPMAMLSGGFVLRGKHKPDEDGKEGVVVACEFCESLADPPAHRYAVVLPDDPFPHRPKHFAAIELEPAS